MKRWLSVVIVLVAVVLTAHGLAQTRAKAQNVPEIPMESVPNFFKMPENVYFGESMGVATNSLNMLFSNKSTLLRTVRDIGLGLVDRVPPLKSAFIRQAAGLSGEVPRLLRGEAL